ncbi:MAG TPA: hypothetical protein VEB86_12430 [Chryseosolibacter sp.]|nr:hypothetical protein [Chryseosolibacter sp.]
MRALFIFSITLVAWKALGQTDSVQFFVTGNINQYVPRASAKGMYPVLGYDSDVKPKVLIGGFGVGVCGWMRMGSKSSLKAQANISRSVYWEEVNFYDQTNADLGHYPVATSDITLGPSVTWHLHAGKHFSIGTGLACQTLLLSYSRIREDVFAGGSRGLGANRYYKPFVVTLPLELSLKWERSFFNVRYEHGLHNRLKHDLAEFRTDHHGLIFAEIGFPIR